MTDWISVKDRLPEDGERVLVTECGRVLVERFDRLLGFDTPTTHWMPLPQPPKSVNITGGCEYCKAGKGIMNHYGIDFYAFARIENGRFEMAYSNNIRGDGLVTGHKAVKINYCPMCGRKLTEPPLPGAIGRDAVAVMSETKEARHEE